MSTSDLWVIVSLVETDGVSGAVCYNNTLYYVELEDMDHMRNQLYSIPLRLLDFVLSSNG